MLGGHRKQQGHLPAWDLSKDSESRKREASRAIDGMTRSLDIGLGRAGPKTQG